MMTEIITVGLGIVVLAMTLAAVMQIGKSEDEDPAHGTSVEDVNESESDSDSGSDVNAAMTSKPHRDA